MSANIKIDRRHPEWQRNHIRWRWLADSLEGGQQYREAVYGIDRLGLPLRNLIRYKQEIPEDSQRGTILYSSHAVNEHPDYALRWERTPVPHFVHEAISTHLSKIYSREVVRDHPDPMLIEWWSNVDGVNTSADEWFADTVAPLLLALGQIDLYFDRPALPAGSTIQTRADQRVAGIDKCVAKVVLPENVIWWRLDPASPGRYAEVTIKEHFHDDQGVTRHQYRHWTVRDWALYDERGELISQQEHTYGRVPIIRVFDRVDPRREHVGLSRYEAIAELQREAYNRESELILAGSRMNILMLQAPEEFVQGDAAIPVGVGNILPMKFRSFGTSGLYQGFEFLTPPQGPIESLRADLDRIRDQVDRAAKLTKPAGSKGTNASTVSQSGISKALDQDAGNALLGTIAKTLQKAEWEAAEFALCVLHGGDTTPEQRNAIRVVYPMSFSLMSAQETAELITEFQGIAASAGDLPEVEAKQLKALNRLILPGQDDLGFAEDDAAIDAYMAAKARRNIEMAEGAINVIAAQASATDDSDTDAEGNA